MSRKQYSWKKIDDFRLRIANQICYQSFVTLMSSNEILIYPDNTKYKKTCETADIKIVCTIYSVKIQHGRTR